MRHQFPYYAGIFKPKVATELIVCSQAFRVFSLILVAAADVQMRGIWLEIKAYALACFNAMPPKVQAGFLCYVTGRAAA